MLQKQVADQMLIYLLVFVGSVLTSSAGVYVQTVPWSSTCSARFAYGMGLI
jgi:hypothetical protein